ncbi:MAG: metal-dependent hydrolase [Desertimonas sp.]
MFFWFLGAVLGAVWYVFRDRRFDVRMLVVGALVPELDGLFGGARVMHSLAFSLALLAVVMLATIGRRDARRLWLGLPIGTMLHLVFDGAWADTTVFLWPLAGWSFDDAALPMVERGWWNLPLELVGLAIVVWFWRRAGLAERSRRRQLVRTGRLYERLGPG